MCFPRLAESMVSTPNYGISNKASQRTIGIVRVNITTELSQWVGEMIGRKAQTGLVAQHKAKQAFQRALTMVDDEG